jgi:hypothetical protein
MSSGKQMLQTDFEEVELIKIVDSLLASGINFLAIDFDKTFVSIHTYANWPGSAVELSYKVRPIFKVLVPLAMSKGIAVAIVTFSSQVKLIHQVIHTLFPHLSSFIPVRGRDLSWDYKGEGSKEGKQKHMASAAEELNCLSTIATGITRTTTLLIDDDMNNVVIALKNKVRAVYCDPECNRNMIDDLLCVE